MQSAIERVADELESVAKDAIAAGYGTIEVHCDEASMPVVTRAFDLVGERVPGLMRDERVVEEWESDGFEYTPRYYVPLHPDTLPNWEHWPKVFPTHCYFSEEVCNEEA